MYRPLSISISSHSDMYSVRFDIKYYIESIYPTASSLQTHKHKHQARNTNKQLHTQKYNTQQVVRGYKHYTTHSTGY